MGRGGDEGTFKTSLRFSAGSHMFPFPFERQLLSLHAHAAQSATSGSWLPEAGEGLFSRHA